MLSKERVQAWLDAYVMPGRLTARRILETSLAKMSPTSIRLIMSQ